MMACFMMSALSSHAFERHECTETWYPYALGETGKKSAARSRACPPEASGRAAFGWYHLAEGKVWWNFTENVRSSPCAGQGVGALGNLLNPVCYLPDFLQVHRNHEHRSFWLVSEDAAHFRMASTTHAPLQEWQKAHLARYAVDRTSVYLNSTRIANADPATFEVLFPFGDDEKWSEYFVGRDAEHLFIDEWVLPRVGVDGVSWLPVACVPGDTLCRSDDMSLPALARIGGDLLLVGRGIRPTIFRNAAADDVKCYRAWYLLFCRMNGTLMQVINDLDQEARLEPVKESMRKSLSEAGLE